MPSCKANPLSAQILIASAEYDLRGVGNNLICTLYRVEYMYNREFFGLLFLPCSVASLTANYYSAHMYIIGWR